jgi:hypothetical protein
VKKTIKIVYPKGWMNCAISINNKFISDTNNSTNWDMIAIPLPKPKYKWNIKRYEFDEKYGKKVVILVDKN